MAKAKNNGKKPSKKNAPKKKAATKKATTRSRSKSKVKEIEEDQLQAWQREESIESSDDGSSIACAPDESEEYD